MSFKMPSNACVRGTAILEFRDAETLELTRVVEQSNNVTQALDHHLSGRHYASASGWTLNSNTYQSSSGVYMGIRDTNHGSTTNLTNYYALFPCISNTKTSSKAYANYRNPSDVVLPASIEQLWTVVSSEVQAAPGVPSTVLTTRARYAQPGTTRTFQSIFLMNGNGVDFQSSPVATWVALNSPCTQLTSEVLDITYRLEVFNAENTESEDVVWATDADVGTGLTAWWRERDIQTMDTASLKINRGLITRIASDWGKMPSTAARLTRYTSYPEAASFTGVPQYPESTQANVLSPYNRTTLTLTMALGEQQYIGQLLRRGTIATGRHVLSRISGFSYWGGSVVGKGLSRAIPTTFTYQPVQPIHNHNAAAPRPFVDVDYLSTSAGELTIDPGSWSEYNGMLEWWRMDMLTTGQVGTAKYTLARNIRTAFDDNTYNPLPRGCQVQSLFCTEDYLTGASRTVDGIAVDSTVIPGGHIRGNRQHAVEWTDTSHVIVHDDTGLTFVNVIDDTYVNFDADSTPALNVTSIRQISVQADGSVFVADATAGLFRITDPLGTPAVSPIACAEAGIDDTSCYAVCEGYADSVWAVFEGGVAHSTDSGSTWTAYTDGSGWTHDAFTSGEAIGVSNWNTIRMVRADVEDASHKLGFIRASAARGVQIVWWSPTTNAVDIGFGNTINSAVLGTQLLIDGVARTNFFKCSRKGGMWALLRTATSGASPLSVFQNAVLVLKHGTNHYQEVGTTAGAAWTDGMDGARSLIGVSFLYDRYGKPYFVASEGTGYYAAQSSLIGFTGTSYSRFTYLYTRRVGWTDTITMPTAGAHRAAFVFERAMLDEDYRGPAIGLDCPAQAIGQNTNAPAGSSAYLSTIVPTRTYDNTGSYPTDSLSANNDSWLGRYCVTRDFNWNEYRWNGSAWVDGYSADLSDLSANNYHAERRGFDVESMAFRGRSLLDASAAVASSFTAGMTMAGTFTFGTDRADGQNPTHVLFATDRFYLARRASSESDAGRLYLKFKDHILAWEGSQVAANTATRYAMTVNSQPVSAYAFNLDQAPNQDRCVMFRSNGTSFTSVNRPGSTTGARYKCSYSPMYTDIADGDFEIRLKMAVDSTNIGRGVSVGVRYGNYEFDSVRDTTYTTTGLQSNYGFSSDSTVNLLFSSGTTAPTLYHGNVSQSGTAGSAMEADDNNGVNRLAIRFQIVGADLVVTLRRILDNGVSVNVTLYTWTLTGAGTTYAGLNGVVGLTPMWTVAGTAQTHSITEFELYNNDAAAVFGMTGYLTTIRVYAAGNTTPVLDITRATTTDLGAPGKFYFGFQDLDAHRGLWGTLANPQVWNAVWTTSDVADDQAALTGTSVIDTVTAPTAACVAHYNTSETLAETRVTAGTTQTGPTGISHSFGNGTSNGTSSYAFVNGDFFTWGMFNGMLKDNAITASLTTSLYTGVRADTAYDQLRSVANLSGVVTTISTINAATTETLVPHFTNGFHGPGYFAASASAYGASYRRSKAKQSLPASTNGSVQFGVNKVGSFFVGLTTVLDDTSWPASSGDTTGAYIQFNADGSYACIVAGTTEFTSAAAAYDIDDVFKIERNGTAFNFYLNEVAVGDGDATSHTGELVPVFVTAADNPLGVHEIQITYQRDFPSLDVGFWNATIANRTGKFSPNFLTLEKTNADMYDIEIDGAPAVVLFHNGTLSTLPAAGSIPAGTCYVMPELGVIAFSSSNVGDTITLNAAPVLYWR